MSSKREEERNEKIIRGLIKLPPNRRCINCNSMGPQYVCTNFWTFICTTCSGIHREFTHRVKSVSMAKFTFQEVDALQKGGNQRAREFFLKAWDPQRNRLPNNSNIDKLRDFIKNVYVDKMYSLDKSSDRPPRDPQSLRSQEDEMRRASSYHSFSQSPPYDFQYEERQFRKPALSLTRKSGSDRGLYEGKLAGFLSPARFSDYAADDRFSNEGSYHRMSDYSGSGRSDFFRSEVISPSSQRDTGSPFNETSRDISTEGPSLHKSDANRSKLHPQRTASLGSLGSFESSSMSFKSLHSLSFPEVGSELGHPAEVSHDKSASVLPIPQSSVSGAFDGLDLFSTPFAPQNISSTPPSGELPESSLAQTVVVQQSPTSVPSLSELGHPAEVSHDKYASVPSIPQSSVSGPFDGLDLFSTPFAPQNVSSTPPSGQLPESSLAQAVNVVQQSPTSSIHSFSEQKPLQILQHSPLDLFTSLSQEQSAASNNGKASDVMMPNDVGWATFDMPQNIAHMGTENSAQAAVPSFDGSIQGNLNPFSIDLSSYQDSAGHEPSASAFNFGLERLKSVETTDTHLWNAFGTAAEGHPTLDVLKINEQAALHSDKSRVDSRYESLSNYGSITIPNENELPSSSLSSHFNVTLNDFPLNSAVVGVHSFANDNKPTNPFDLPDDSGMESTNMSQFWDMSSLQVALPNFQMPPTYVDEVNQSWFPENSGPSFVPGGVSFDSPSGSLGFMTGQAPNTSISSIHAEAPVASVGGNPFA